MITRIYIINTIKQKKMNHLLSKSPNVQLKEQMKENRKVFKSMNLNFNDFERKVVTMYPELDTIEGAKIIFNVWYGRKANIALNEIAKEIIQDYKTEH